MNIPVFFYHYGYQDYLGLCVRQTSQNNRVILIGDKDNEHLGQLDNVEHYFASDYQEGVENFATNYCHLNSSSVKYELMCYVRWIITRNVAQILGIDALFYSDSDNLIYSDLSKVYKNIGSPSLALSVPYHQPPFRHVATGAVSYWSLEVLKMFCDFMLRYYVDEDWFEILQKKWNWHQKERVGGGICDMTILWHFVQQTPHTLLTRVDDQSAFNHNIRGGANYYLDEYEVKEGIKKIYFKEGFPWCQNLITGEEVMFHNLQCQGSAKDLVKNYTKGLK